MAQKSLSQDKLSTGLYDLFDDIFISEDVGHEKPDITYFNYIKEKTHYDPDTTIIIGDSLTSDIKGGENAGIDTCYFNPGHQKTLLKLSHTKQTNL